jgi:hypothetical protein
MEQTIQKPPLPIKTKIVAWWMIGLGVFIIFSAIYYSVFFAVQYRSRLIPQDLINFPIPILIGSIIRSFFFFFCSFSLFKRKRMGWLFSIAIFSLFLVFYFSLLVFSIPIFVFWSFLLSIIITKYYFSLFGFGLLDFFLYLIPFILLLLDRKNFWKIAS